MRNGINLNLVTLYTYGKDCIACFGTDVLNAVHDKRVMMKIGNRRVPFNIDNIRNLSK